MLFVALLTIAAAAVAPTIAFQLKRDREEEMIHRGVQYSRAVRGYFKKFGRYPTRIEDLESTNNMRFLRKRYKDPITGKDFKLLHLGEVKVNFQGGMAGASPAGGNAVGPAGRAFGAPGGIGLVGTPQGGPQGVAQPSKSDDDESAGGQAAGAQPSSSQSKEEGDSGTPDKLSGQVFGGGPIVGVASTSKNTTIRVFNDLKHYNEWQFIYDPSMDRGGLLNTPGQKVLRGVQTGLPGPQGITPGGQGMPGTQGVPPGQPMPQPPGSPTPEPDNDPD
jgi:type II secretory pathway pseudopilin PulG